MQELTEKQLELLNFIREYVRENGAFPQIREMAAGTGKCVSVTHGKFRRLIDQGYVIQTAPRHFKLKEVD